MAASLGALFMVNLYQFKEISLFRHLHINSVKNFLNKARKWPPISAIRCPIQFQSDFKPRRFARLQCQWRLQRKQNHRGWAWWRRRLPPPPIQKRLQRDTLANVYRQNLFGWHPRRTELTTRSTKKHNFNENIFCEVVKWQRAQHCSANGEERNNIPWIMKCRRWILNEAPRRKCRSHSVKCFWKCHHRSPKDLENSPPLLGDDYYQPTTTVATRKMYWGIDPMESPKTHSHPHPIRPFIWSSIKINQSAFLETFQK